MPTNINIVTAFYAEARPLIDEMRLQEADSPGPLRHYQGQAANLVIGGLGQLNMAAATGWLAARTPANSAWLNLGIAGHSRLPLETPFIVTEVVDRLSGQKWYPPQVARTALVSSSLTTVLEPELNYAGEGGFDMEASAFLSVARQFSTSELVQIIKVVSDNPGNPAALRSPNRVSEIMRVANTHVTEYVSALSAVAESLPRQDDSLTQQLLTDYHFTVTQRHQLSELVSRWQATFGKDPANLVAESSFRDARELIEFLSSRLAVTAPNLLGKGNQQQ